MTRHWRAPDHIPGIEHIVEGYIGLKAEEMTTFSGFLGKQFSKYKGTSNLSKKDKEFNKQQQSIFEGYSTRYQKMQADRALIPSLPDPDDLNTKLRKKEARKRMRGVLGTMLTKQDTVGKKRQTLGGGPVTTNTQAA